MSCGFFVVTVSCSLSRCIFQVGTLVELRMRGGEAVYGVVKWRGQPHDWEGEEAAGIELEEEMAGASNGWHMGTQYFEGPDRKAIFVPFTHIAADSRFSSNANSALGDQGRHSRDSRQ